MWMFETFLNSLPRNRSEMVNDLEIPDITLSPYTWTGLDDSFTPRSDSFLSYLDEVNPLIDVGSVSTDSSIALSRAMTDSEIDYDIYRRYKNRTYSNPWLEMRAVMDRFPPSYLDSLNRFQTHETAAALYENERQRFRLHNEELRLKMQRFFDEECNVFAPDDPGLEELEDALKNIDMKLRLYRRNWTPSLYPEYSRLWPHYFI